ncbi:MAG TPA: hypothetical protein VGL46_05160 [Pseudonocardiaceae bacterium]
MSGEGGSVDDRTVAEVAVGMRTLLAAIGEGRLECPPARRYRLEGAAVALEAVAARTQTSDSGQSSA